MEARLRAVAYTLGPTCELEVHLPDGRVLLHLRGGGTLAAQARSLNERMEDMLERWDQSRGSR